MTAPKIDYQTAAFVRHSLAGTAANIEGIAGLLLKIISEQHPEILESKIRPNSPLNVAKYLEILVRDSKSVKEFVTNITEERP